MPNYGRGIGYEATPFLPVLRTGVSAWFFAGSQGNNSTSAATVGTCFASPFAIGNSVTIDRIGAEVTGAGGSGSVIRLGVYSDSNGNPNALLLDAGTIDGTSATVQSITLGSPLSVGPGIYWFCAAGQVGTQATMRTQAAGGPYVVPIPMSSAPSANLSVGGVTATSVTGALPGTFTVAGQTYNAAIPRLHFRVA